MTKRSLLTPDLLRHAHMIALPALSGVLQGLAADSDLCLLHNSDEGAPSHRFAIASLEVRVISESAFSAPQSLAIKAYKVDSVSTLPSGANAKEVGAHYTGVDLPLEDPLVSTSLLHAYITTGGALAGGDYQIFIPEPIFFSMGGASILPSVYDEPLGVALGLPRLIDPGEAVLLRLHTAIAAPGSIRVFVGVHGVWLPS